MCGEAPFEPGAQRDFAPSLLLQAWLSPAFPVGSFAYSHGLESAIDAGDIADAASLRHWLLDLFEHGSARKCQAPASPGVGAAASCSP